MHEMTERTKRVLKALIIRGEASIAEIDQVVGEPSQKVVSNLVGKRLAQCSSVEDGKRRYEPTMKAHRLMRAMETPNTGPIAQPRTEGMRGTYTGERGCSVRPGAMDAYKLPSRRGDTLVPHKPPASIASPVQRRKPT